MLLVRLGRFLRKMDQKTKIGGTVHSHGDSYLEFLDCHFKVLRTYASLRDAAGTVRAHGAKGPGCCEMVGRGPKPVCLVT